MSLPISRLLPLVGKLNSLVFSVPGVGETLVRTTSRTVGKLAYRLPLLGGVQAQHVGHLHDQWLRFLGVIGIRSKVVEHSDGQFVLTVDRCPYGFHTDREQGVCDACMDLDRAYIGELGGRLEIEERLTEGAHCCRFRISFP